MLCDTIPVLLVFDVEPEGFFIDRDKKEPWRGWENAPDVIEPLRDRLTALTDRPANFVWNCRSDMQIYETYGSRTWALETQSSHFERFLAAGDVFSTHLHAYRWSTADDNWIADFGNQEWVTDEIENSIHAMNQILPEQCDTFSMGSHFLSQYIIDEVRRQGIRYELTLAPGVHGEFREKHLGTFTGTHTDCRNVPREPYRSSASDFRVPEPDAAGDDLWMIPLSTRYPNAQRSLRGRFSDWKFSRTGRTRPITLALRHGPLAISDHLDSHFSQTLRPHLHFAFRTAAFQAPDLCQRINTSLDYILSRYGAERFHFTTPEELVNTVSLYSENVISHEQILTCA